MSTPKRRRLVLATAVAALAVAFSGCSRSDASALARRACTMVHTSLQKEAEAGHASTPRAASLRRQAVLGLELAQPIAGAAAAKDGEWDALQTTLQEAGQVPVHLLVHALQAQCASANGTG